MALSLLHLIVSRQVFTNNIVWLLTKELTDPSKESRCADNFQLLSINASLLSSSCRWEVCHHDNGLSDWHWHHAVITQRTWCNTCYHLSTSGRLAVGLQFSNWYFAKEGYEVLWRACLSVCLSTQYIALAHFANHMAELHLDWVMMAGAKTRSQFWAVIFHKVGYL